MIFYISGFVFPFIYNNLSINDAFSIKKEKFWHLILRFFLYIIASLTQISFLLFELAEVKQNGIEGYFNDGWNIFDSTQPLWFSIHFWIRI